MFFRLYRKRIPESPSLEMLQQKELKDLLAGMHPTKDPQDIDDLKKSRLTFSRLSSKKEHDKQSLDEYHFKNMNPLEDFVRPGSSGNPRFTGYESGHIRSLFKLDTYGPTQSRGRSTQKKNRQPKEGETLPVPNPDRYARLSPEHKLHLTPHSGGGSDSVHSNDDNQDQYSHRSGSSTARSLVSADRSTNSHLDNRLDLTIPSSLRRVKENFGQSRITLEDRMSKDPFIRRKQYNNNYKGTLGVIN
jgi:hypothetical protein